MPVEISPILSLWIFLRAKYRHKFYSVKSSKKCNYLLNCRVILKSSKKPHLI